MQYHYLYRYRHTLLVCLLVFSELHANFHSYFKYTNMPGGQSLSYTGLFRKKKVFVKRMKTGSLHEQKQFEMEIRTLQSISHKNVVPLIGHFTNPPGLILDWVEGGDLEEYINRFATAPAGSAGSGGTGTSRGSRGNGWGGGIFERLEILRQIASGVNAMHQAGIVHRDLKPGNILRRSDGTIQICDFGLARYAKESGAISTTGGTGAAVGTPCYMAPEQHLSEKITAAVDVYAFGGIIYFMICGQHPWQGKTNNQIVSELTKGVTPHLPPSGNFESLPPGLLDLMKACYSIEPLHRPTAQEFIERLPRGMFCVNAD